MNLQKIGTFIIYFVVIICCLLLITSRFALFGIRLYSVQSGSMEPTIKTGSMVIAQSMNTYQIGDIITYYDREDTKKTITHRIIQKTENKGITQIITKGDANNTADSIPVTPNLVVGKVVLTISFLGYLVGTAKTTIGFIILIVIPITIIVYEELKNIHKETKNIVRRRREKKGIQSKTKNKNDKSANSTEDKATAIGNNEKNVPKK
ncbi:MAG: signal peptidase I [Patescibacteria group bacterium]|jgi:signal peptidase